MNKRLSFKQRIILGSTLFGMFFGAGNLIFPVHLGQLAGSNFIPAAIGFIASAVVLPIAAVAAIGYSQADGLFELTSRISKRFGYIFTTLLYLTIGPFFAIPRCASVSFTTGFEPIFADSNPFVPMLLFSLLFFVVVLIFSLRPNKITTWIGKIINPVFLVFLFVLILMAVFTPGEPYTNIDPVSDYQTNAFFNGFLQGYGTMDAIAGLAFGIVVVNIVKNFGVKSNVNVARDVARSGNHTAILMAVIYALTIFMGAQSRGFLEISDNGGIALSQIANHCFGPAGNIILAITILLACLKTSIGLVTSCSSTFCEMFPKKLNYKIWAIIFVLFSFAVSNVGLTAIIEYAVPVLNLLYAFSMVLILLTFVSKLFNNYKPVYIITFAFTLIPALFEFVKTLPPNVIEYTSLQGAIDAYISVVPLASMGLSWIIPAIIGFIIGFVVYLVKGRK
ncbi:MAG: branched-chain amino acid transport system II carrier protein [Coriobacteriia bacterium]|nr:branched-chain amino acid transport system II carrier protein [Coriobacteriia bacterium]